MDTNWALQLAFINHLGMSCLGRNGSSRTVGPAASIGATCLPSIGGRERNVKRSEGSSAEAGGARIWASSCSASILEHTQASICSLSWILHTHTHTRKFTFIRFQPYILADLVSTVNAGQKNLQAANLSSLTCRMH